MLKKLLVIALVLSAMDIAAAPALSDADRDRLVDGTTDLNAQLDQEQGLYVLLRNAAGWKADDFAGDLGAAVAPPPDYAYLKAHPAEVRGSVYLIEGWAAQADRYPNADAGLGRQKLQNLIDPAWGEQVTRWTIVTKEKDPGSTIIVLFTDPEAKMPTPGKDQKVRVAARFYKLWTIKDAAGQPFTYPVFVGGAAEVVADDSAGAGGRPTKTMITIALVMVLAAFFGMRFMMNRVNASGRARTAALIEARRRDRFEHEEEEQQEIEDLPEDPIAALEALRKKHDSE